MTAEEASRAFVAAINSHDVEELGALMTDDHVFVDGLGARMTGRNVMVAGWRGYFGMVPDYWIRIDRMMSDEGTVALFGKAGGTFVAPGQRLDAANRWEVPGAWLAEVRGSKLAQWHVFADNMPIRRLMGADHA